MCSAAWLVSAVWFARWQLLALGLLIRASRDGHHATGDNNAFHSDGPGLSVQFTFGFAFRFTATNLLVVTLPLPDIAGRFPYLYHTL